MEGGLRSLWLRFFGVIGIISVLIWFVVCSEFYFFEMDVLVENRSSR